MPGTKAKFIKKAKGKPKNSFGATCHHAVLDWLLGANYTTENAVKSYFFPAASKTRQPEELWKSILVKADDTRRNRNGLAGLDAGNVVGFIKDGVLQHSMVIVKKGKLVGVNNCNVVPDNKIVKDKGYYTLKVGDLDWDDAGNVVGAFEYEVRTADISAIASRVDDALNTE